MLSPTIADFGERRLVSELLTRRYGDQPAYGDDCAVMPELPAANFEIVATTDVGPLPILPNTHDQDLYQSGWLLAIANLSDLAAAGATPLGLLTSYVLPPETLIKDFEQLLSGVDDCCQAHGTRVRGGNLVDGPRVHLTATAIGRCRRGDRLSRRGAHVGDQLVVLGSPGWLWAAMLVQAGAAIPDADAAEIMERAGRPHAQTALAQEIAPRRLVSAAIDVSDGLYGAVSELCSVNGIGASIEAGILVEPPIAAVCDAAQVDPFELFSMWGDWPLLVAVRPTMLGEVLGLAHQQGVAAQVIGKLTQRQDVLLSRAGKTRPWRGFAQERFTSESWSPDLLELYFERLRHPATWA